MTNTTKSKPKSATKRRSTAKERSTAKATAKPKPTTKAKSKAKSGSVKQLKAKAKHAEFDARVAEWDSRIKEIEARYERAQAAISAEAAELIKGLRLARDDVKAQLAQLKKTSGDAWDRSRSAVEARLSEVSAAYEAIRRRLM